MEVESLRGYLYTNEIEFMNIALKLFDMSKIIGDDYFDYKGWFFNKHLKNIIYGADRDILFVRDIDNFDKIIGLVSLKKDNIESKICTLYVLEDYRGVGIGEMLVDEAIKFLDTNKPLITIIDYKINLFLPFIEKYDWTISNVFPKSDNYDINEFVFNKKLNYKEFLYKRLIRNDGDFK